MTLTKSEVPELKRILNGRMIFFIALSAVIGTGIFAHDGLALSVAGPDGLIFATIIVGFIALCAMDGLSELNQMFPCPNSLVNYVRTFVDPELGICVGVAYWAVWSMIFSLQLGAAADFCSAWSLKLSVVDLLLRALLWFTIMPLILVFINSCKVDVFGWIETIGGAIKLLSIIGLSIVLYYLAGLNEGLESPSGDGPPGSVQSDGSYISQGITTSTDFPHPAANFFAVTSIVAFSWVGIEIVAVTAFEAQNYSELKMPSQSLPAVVFIIYLVAAAGSSMAVQSSNAAVSRIFRGDYTSIQTTEDLLQRNSPVSTSSSLIVIAANQVGKYNMAQVFNGFLIFSALSTANTSLYVASRTLYGLALHNSGFYFRPREWLRTVRNGVPVIAVFVSAVSFIWLPWLSLSDIPSSKDDHTHDRRRRDDSTQQFLNTACSLCALFVWGAECLAFIRYHRWLKKHSGSGGLLHQPEYQQYNRWADTRRASTLLRRLQPYVAYIGLVGCFLLVMVFPTAFLWNNVPNGPRASISIAYQVFEIYTAPIIIFVLWILLKLWKRKRRGAPIRWYVKLDSREQETKEALAPLIDLSVLSTEHSRASSTTGSSRTDVAV